MKKSWFYVSVICSLAILITSCGDGGQQSSTPAASPGTPASPAATSPTAAAPAPAPATPSTTATPGATTSAVAPAPNTPDAATAANPKAVDIAAGLIPATDGDSWAKTVSKGRTDPFATLTLQPIEAASPLDSLAATGKQPADKKASTVASGSNKPLPTIKIGTQVAKNSAPISPIKPNVTTGKIAKSGIDRPLPKIRMASDSKPKSRNSTVASRRMPAIRQVPTPSSTRERIAISPLPQPLKTNPNGANNLAPKTIEPNLARTVGVSGVIEVGGRTQVIVKLPNESFSRYVEVGDRIYDGKITVKRIEGEQTLTPIVILEEVGVEIARKVGDVAGPVTPETPAK
jgi:hypothetical protein